MLLRSQSLNWTFSKLFFLFAVAAPLKSFAAPCCSSGGAAPLIMTGDQRARVAISTSQATIIGSTESDRQPVFRSKNDRESITTTSLEAVALITDRWQAGVALPFVVRSIDRPGTSVTTSGIGDARASASFEAMPEHAYSPWRPQMFHFLQLSLPTGTNVYEQPQEATGKGFFTLTAGALLKKVHGDFDVQLVPEVHYSWERNFRDLDEDVRVFPGWGTSLLLGAGWNPSGGSLRFGALVRPQLNQGKTITTERGLGTASSELVWDATVEVGYLLRDQLSLTLSYTDQTLIGPTRQTDLLRTAALSLSYSWMR